MTKTDSETSLISDVSHPTMRLFRFSNWLTSMYFILSVKIRRGIAVWNFHRFLKPANYNKVVLFLRHWPHMICESPNLLFDMRFEISMLILYILNEKSQILYIFKQNDFLLQSLCPMRFHVAFYSFKLVHGH